MTEISLRLPFNGDFPVTFGFGSTSNNEEIKKKFAEWGIVGHNGVDYGLPEGTEVVASADGKVIQSGDNGDFGVSVTIEHQWGQSLYAHLKETKVSQDQEVKASDPIGLSGRTGLAFGEHLHFAINPNDSDTNNGYLGFIDPSPYFGIVVVTVALLGGAIWWSSRESGEPTVTVSNQGVEQKLYPEDEITHGHGLAVDVADSTKVYIATHHGLLVLKNDKDLFRVGTSRDDYMGFSVHPTNTNIFFSSGHPTTGGNVGFQKSENGGTTWKKISNGLDGPADFHAMAVSPVNPDLVFGWFRGNLQRTTNGGKTWEKFTTSVPFVALAGDTKDESVVYAASPQGLFKSTDKGHKWESLVDGFVAAVAIHPTNSQILLISSEKLGLAKSMDSGKNWQKIDQSFSGKSPLFIAFDYQKPETVYILTEKNSLYKSTDEGITWNKIR